MEPVTESRIEFRIFTNANTTRGTRYRKASDKQAATFEPVASAQPETGIERANWTIAYRKRTANRILRVSTWSGTWSQALAMAQLFCEANPELDVYYTSNRTAEVEGFVIEEDCRNILVDSGKRVRIVETDAEIPAEMIARIPTAEIARARWIAGEPIAEPVPAPVVAKLIEERFGDPAAIAAEEPLATVLDRRVVALPIADGAAVTAALDAAYEGGPAVVIVPEPGAGDQDDWYDQQDQAGRGVVW